jgi:sugar (pentulose or hexulose) kinase
MGAALLAYAGVASKDVGALAKSFVKEGITYSPNASKQEHYTHKFSQYKLLYPALKILQKGR